VVRDVMSATLGELSRAGYRALRIEDVAARAGVHKTTIYRRWPDKKSLVREAMTRAFDPRLEVADRGSLREDLRAVAQHALAFLSSTAGIAIVRAVLLEGAEERELREIADSFRQAKERPLRDLIERARARGELRVDVSGDLLFSTLIGALQHALVGLGRSPEKVDLDALVDLLVRGAEVRAAQSGSGASLIPDSSTSRSA